MATVFRKLFEALIYCVMLILVLLFFEGEGVFIYEAF